MKEYTRHLTPLSPTGHIFDHMLRPITPPGPPVYNIAHPEDLGYPERKDTNQDLTPSEINESIFNEGLRLAGADILNIGNGKELLVFNTSAASTHTLLTVPYKQWEESIREQGFQLGIDIPSGVLIEGKESNENEVIPPSLVPLDMVTWVMVREQGKNLYMPCDINDLTAPPNGDPNINQYKLSLEPEQLESVTYALARRNRLATNTILDLHNNVLVKNLSFLKPKTESDLLIGGLSGYYRGDEAKDLKQFEYDHRGKGPMSNPTLHFRITDHFSMKEANILDQENPSTSFIDDIQSLHEDFPDYFSKNIDFLRIKPESRSKKTSGEVLAEIMSNSTFSPYDIMKSVDPYGSLAHDYLGNWLEQKFNNIFADMPHETGLFADHTIDYERELRVSEGATIKFNQSIPDEEKEIYTAKAFSRIASWIGKELYPMWNDINKLIMHKSIMNTEQYDESVRYIKDTYALPDEFLKTLHILKPTERQLHILKGRLERNYDENVHLIEKVTTQLGRYENKKQRVKNRINMLTEQLQSGQGDIDNFIDLLTWMQAGQLFDDPELNKGYNIPGTPGTAITYSYDENQQLNVNIGWVLSTKGLAELWLGTILKRKERRDR